MVATSLWIDEGFDLASLLRPPAWMKDALCVDSAANFFPERGQSSAAARAVCDRCTVRADCLAYALELGINDGVYGGMSGAERRERRAAAAA